MTEDIDAPQDGEVAENPEPGGDSQPAPFLIDAPIVTSDAELSFVDALAITSRRGARLVLPMGEVGTGKTTLMVELWTTLVGGEAIAGYRCAGSRTAFAFEERAFLSRMAAGVSAAETPRTQLDENEGLLHLRTARPDGKRYEILFADYSGERFQHIREGGALESEFPWIARVDRIAVLVDGSALKQGGARELAINHAMRQLYALRSSGTVDPLARIAVVLAKNDQVTDEAFEAASSRVDGLVEVARELDPRAALIRVAARPADGSSPTGLEDLLQWLCEDDAEREPLPVAIPTPSRVIGRLRASE